MRFPGQASWDGWTGPSIRMHAPSVPGSGKFVRSKECIKSALIPGGGLGGTRCGESGGPDLLGETGTVFSVKSSGKNVNCSGVGYSPEWMTRKCWSGSAASCQTMRGCQARVPGEPASAVTCLTCGSRAWGRAKAGMISAYASGKQVQSWISGVLSYCR
jgi:hypothetical protein